MSNLMLVSVVKELADVQPAAMYEKEAARYLKLSVNDLRRFANDGRIVARRHPGRSRRIYLKADLDRYLESLPKEHIA
jgi:excisionase family DNA binding protein